MALGLTRLSGRRRGSLLGLVSLTAIAAALPSLPPVTPPPALAYSNATDYFVASTGMRWPNKLGNAGAGYTKSGTQLTFISPPWDVPAGSTLLVAYPNHTNVEGNPAQNEALIGTDVQMEAVAVTYTDAGGTKRTNPATVLSNNGILSSTIANGGVVAQIVLSHAIPRNTAWQFGHALSGPDNFSLPAFYAAKAALGETSRKHATTSFAAAINAGSSPTTVSNLALSISGYHYGPAFVCALGADGRPIGFIDGDSIAYGKGTPDDIAPDRISGIVEVALARTANGGYRIPALNTAIAGSGFYANDPADPVYNPGIHNHRRALIDQVITLNGGKLPWTHIVCQHGTNSTLQRSDTPTQGATLSEFKARVKLRVNWLKAKYPASPVIQVCMAIKTMSTDGFRTVTNQSPFDTALRGPWRDDLISTKLDGMVMAAVDVMTPLAADTGANFNRFAVRPFTATLTRALAISAASDPAYLSAAPAVGAALVLDPLNGGQLKVVTSVTEVTPGAEYAVVLTNGASNGSWPNGTAAGTLVGEALASDGVPSNAGLHISKIANEIVAAHEGPNSWIALKSSLKTAVSGAWA